MRFLRALCLFSITALAVSVFAETTDVVAADAKADKAAKQLAKKAEKQKLKDDAKKAAELKAANAAKEAAEAKAAEAKAEAVAEAAKAKARAIEAATKQAALGQNVAQLSKMIDSHIQAKLQAEKVDPSDLCTDEEFLRRASLDIAGVIPSADRAKSFLDDRSPNKRALLIDELLDSSNYGRKQSDIWTAKLFPRDSNNRFVLREPLEKWLKEQFNANAPWNTMVHNMVAGNGTVEKNPAVTYIMANRTIDKLTDTTTQHFLGVRLGCAQCHNHPFTTTKQAEYWGMAAFYANVQIDNPKNANKGGDNTQIGVQDAKVASKRKDFFPESALKVNAKFLGAEEPKNIAGTNLRTTLANWMTSAENPFFAKAMVNRTWAQLFGNGIVDPVDDLIEKNKPTHPELFNELATHFSKTGFDVKYLIRGICNSKTYQRSAKPTSNNKDDAELFSHMNVKVMSPEQLFDSLSEATGFGKGEAAAKGKAAGAAKGQPNGPRARFVSFFLAGSEESNAAEYEAGIPQALQLMNSRIIGNPASVRSFATANSKPADVIEKIYLGTLSRRPTEDEAKRLTTYVSQATTPVEGYSDILWAVLNSSEFTLIR